jgi:hypothetical protein
MNRSIEHTQEVKIHWNLAALDDIATAISPHVDAMDIVIDGTVGVELTGRYRWINPRDIEVEVLATVKYPEPIPREQLSFWDKLFNRRPLQTTSKQVLVWVDEECIVVWTRYVPTIVECSSANSQLE